MLCCLSYCYLASQLDPKPFKRVMDFWFSTPNKDVYVGLYMSRLAERLHKSKKKKKKKRKKKITPRIVSLSRLRGLPWG